MARSRTAELIDERGGNVCVSKLEHLRNAALEQTYVSLGGRRTNSVHEFYRYPARFTPWFARAAIETFTRPGDLVIDPFCGGGTTAVEAQLTGRIAIALDASLIVQVHVALKIGTIILSAKSKVCREAPTLKALVYFSSFIADPREGRRDSRSVLQNLLKLRSILHQVPERIGQRAGIVQLLLDQFLTPSCTQFSQVLVATQQTFQLRLERAADILVTQSIPTVHKQVFTWRTHYSATIDHNKQTIGKLIQPDALSAEERCGFCCVRLAVDCKDDSVTGRAGFLRSMGRSAENLCGMRALARLEALRGHEAPGTNKLSFECRAEAAPFARL